MNEVLRESESIWIAFELVFLSLLITHSYIVFYQMLACPFKLQKAIICCGHLHCSLTFSLFFCIRFYKSRVTPSNKRGLSAAASLSILLSAWPSSHTQIHSLCPLSVTVSISLFDTQTGEWMLWGLSASSGAWHTLHVDYVRGEQMNKERPILLDMYKSHRQLQGKQTRTACQSRTTSTQTPQNVSNTDGLLYP